MLHAKLSQSVLTEEVIRLITHHKLPIPVSQAGMYPKCFAALKMLLLVIWTISDSLCVLSYAHPSIVMHALCC